MLFTTGVHLTYEEAIQNAYDPELHDHRDYRLVSCPLITKVLMPSHGDWFKAPPLNWIIASDRDHDDFDDIPF